MKYIITTTKTYIDYIDTKLTSVLAIVMLIISHIYILPYICILLIIKYNTIYIYDIVISSILYSMLYLCFSLAIIIYIYILDIILLHIFKVTTQIFAMSKLINSINFILNNFDIAISILLDKILNIYISSVITLLIIITVNYASTIINYMHFTHNKYSKLLNQKFNNDYYTYKYTKNIFYTEIIKRKN